MRWGWGAHGVRLASDNGGLHVAEAPGHTRNAQHAVPRGPKGFVYEGGLRVPLIGAAGPM